MLRIEPGDFYRQLALQLHVGDELPLDEVIAHLESIGYERREPVEMVGEYSVRGGILDVFSPEASRPVRIDLFGDQVESIRRFDVESQRPVADKHLKLFLGRNGQRFEAIAFQQTAPLPARIHAAYRPEIREWNGHQGLELIVEHWLPITD